MIKRIFYTIKQAWIFREQLRDVQKKSIYSSPVELTAASFQQQGYQTIVLDFDGILAAHGETEPDKRMLPLLQQCVQSFGQQHVYILSNKPSATRLDYFQQHFPEITFIVALHKKPFPDGLEKIIALSKTPPEKILLIDDRLLTGALAALLAKTHIHYVKKPLTNFKRRPFTECFFQCLRRIERIVFNLTHQ
jgi:uncharacterized protein